MTRHNTAGSACAPPIRRWLLAAVLVVPAAVLAVPAAASAASRGLPAACVGSGANVTCTYAPVGHEQQFVVPPRVTSVQVTAAGAAGAQAAFTPTGTAGLGARVTGTLAVMPGSTLYVEVGGSPTSGSNCSSSGPCTGGWNGGGNGGGTANSFNGDAGGGGGASDIQTVGIPGSGVQNGTSLNSRLTVAGGGGGSGAGFGPCPNATGSVPASGGAGGSAGQNGAGGGICADVIAQATSSGGSGALVSAAGAGGVTSVPTTGGGTVTGNAGTQGNGGSSTGFAGGGGGGGVFGGGSGANFGSDASGHQVAGSGGGGGSSLVLPGGSLAISTLSAGSVVIRYSQNPDNSDLGIRIKGPRSAAAGSRFSEALVVTNYGPAVALDVTTTASLPRHLTVITASRLVRRVNDGLRWTDPALRPGESVTYRITFAVAPAANTLVSLRGTTAATGSPDPNTTNNNAVAGIRLHAWRSHH